MGTPATNKQIPDHSIFDFFNKQIYLGNGFILPTSGLDLSDTDETPVLMIQNPPVTTAAFPVQKALFVNLKRFSSDAEEVVIRLYLNPSIDTLGTPTTALNLRPANTNASVSLCYLNDEFSLNTNGTLYCSLGCPANGSMIVDQLLMILDPGNTLLVTATAATDTTTVNAEVSWYEL